MGWLVLMQPYGNDNERRQARSPPARAYGRESLYNANMALRAITWTLYGIGLCIVAGSWVGLVPAGVGWLGWVIGMIGWALFYVPKVRQRTPADRLRDLDRMREQGLVSDEEYVRQRDRIVGSV